VWVETALVVIVKPWHLDHQHFVLLSQREQGRFEEDVSSAIDEAGILEDLAPYLLPDDDDSPPSHPLLGLPACQQHTSGASVETMNKAAREGKRTPRREQRAEHAPSPGRRNSATQIAGRL
jgi:hypothetical protein